MKWLKNLSLRELRYLFNFFLKKKYKQNIRKEYKNIRKEYKNIHNMQKETLSIQYCTNYSTIEFETSEELIMNFPKLYKNTYGRFMDIITETESKLPQSIIDYLRTGDIYKIKLSDLYDLDVDKEFMMYVYESHVNYIAKKN